ncbi:hypothetical protein [uncultured Novosphingobium sp.]|uniref:hypothetical protein n=1 Tax=uncultured Novosphingobium sp. TaxID=292277 RepID=UPI002599274F|nr:hypothetical protein [uncultured Novosphingobium sp.]
MSVLGQAMGTQKARKRNDFYPTIDPRAAQALAAFLPPGTVYAEPCAGAGDLVQLLDVLGLVCDWAMELEPQGDCVRNRWPIARGNALQLGAGDVGAATCFVTNPPWNRPMLHALIRHLAAILPTWMLFDASWKHTQQAAALGPICTDIVSVGRLKWFAGSKYDPPDDCAWYRFDARAGSEPAEPTRFHFRRPPAVAGAQLQLI